MDKGHRQVKNTGRRHITVKFTRVATKEKKKRTCVHLASVNKSFNNVKNKIIIY